MNSHHPSATELGQFANAELDDVRFEQIAEHLESCEQCEALIRSTKIPQKLRFSAEATAHHESNSEGPGTIVGPYKLLQKLGEGGMGAVYMAEQEKPVRRMVALKIIKPGMDSKQVIARFEAERQALAMMDHHNIAKVLDAGTTDTGRPYFAMELVKGVPITEYCDKNKLTPRERLEMFIPVCHAIQHAHQKGIIHRDIKPSNVLVTLYDGKPVPKVIDFGIAKATQQKLTERTMFTGIGQILGTFEYMSPEQAEMNQLDVDTRTDVYSLGVMLYELLTGSTPITKEKLRNVGFEEMLRTIRETEPPKPSTRLSDSAAASPSISAVRKRDPGKLSKFVRGDLDWIVMKALEKDRTRRYETANNLALDIQRFLKDEAVEACPPSARYKFRKFARRNKAMLATGTAIAGILLVSTVVSTGLAIWAVRAEQKASENEAAANAALAAEQTARQEERKQKELAEANAAKANREATKSREVAAFLKEMLKGVGPSVALGRDTTMLQEILEETSERMSVDLANQPEVQAELRTTIGEVYREFGQFKQAQQQFQKALQLYRQVHGNVHPNVADLLEKSANLPNIQAIDHAQELLEASLEIRRALYGDVHSDVASSLLSLARLRETAYLRIKSRHRPSYDAVKEALREALAVYERSDGDNDLDTMSALRALGSFVWRTADRQSSQREERLEEANSYLDRALAIARNRDGIEFRREEANTLQLMAAVESTLGDAFRAERLAKEAIDVAESVPGEELTIVNLLYRLATTLEQQARFTNARDVYQRMTRAADNVFGQGAPHAIQTRGTYAKFLYNMGHQSDAVRLQRDLVDAMMSTGASSGDTSLPYNLAFFLTFGWHDPRHADEAAELFRQQLQAIRNGSGDEHIVVSRMVGLCNALCLAGRFNEATDIQNELAFTDGYTKWHYAACLNLVTGQHKKNRRLFGHALDAGDRSDEIRAARAVFLDRNAGPEVIHRAAALAAKVLERQNKHGDPWYEQCLGMGRYRQGRYDDAEAFLQRALTSDQRPTRLLALTFSAMSLLQQDKQDLANERLDELGAFSACDDQLPSHFKFYGRHDILAAWFLQSELRSLDTDVDFGSLTNEERIELGLQRQARHVDRNSDDLASACQLAGLYAWFNKTSEHHELCRRLINRALDSEEVEEQYRTSLYFLSHPSSDRDLIDQAATLAKRATESVGAEHLTRETAEKLAYYQLACALAEIRLGDYHEAAEWLRRAAPIVTLSHRGRWSALRAITYSRLGDTAQAESALANAELMMQPAPSRDVVSLELVESSDDDHDFIVVSWLLLEEARSIVSGIIDEPKE